MIEIVKVEGEDSALAARLDALLDAEAEGRGSPFDPQVAGFVAQDADGTFLGGIYGWGQLGWFFIKLLALTPEARGHGIGSKLLARTEAHARESGLAGVYLDTYEFQAPEFYAKCGYTEFGRLPAADGAPQRIWFAKAFG